MNTPHEIPAKRFMDGTMPLDPTHRRERIRRDLHPKVAFATFPKARMASVTFTFVSDLKQSRLKCLHKPRPHFPLYLHFF